MNWKAIWKFIKDPALHVPLALAVAGCFWIHPIIGCVAFLWVREAAQEAPGNILKGLDLRQYSFHRHMEIWPPGIVAGLIYSLVQLPNHLALRSLIRATRLSGIQSL